MFHLDESVLENRNVLQGAKTQFKDIDNACDWYKFVVSYYLLNTH
jgi:hypothetical protein